MTDQRHYPKWLANPLPAWSDLAACTTADPELFHAHEAETEERRQYREHHAKAICRSCPVEAECAEYALKENMSGIWGGTTDDQRKNARRRQVRRRP